jgi:hypothetical protein
MVETGKPDFGPKSAHFMYCIVISNSFGELGYPQGKNRYDQFLISSSLACANLLPAGKKFAIIPMAARSDFISLGSTTYDDCTENLGQLGN